MPHQDKVSEALVAKPLPDMIRNLGVAVAEANAEMAKNQGENLTVYQVHSAEVELNIAITMEEGSNFEIGAGGGIYGFSVNATYARSYNFKEEASSKIKLYMSAVRPTREPQQNGAAAGEPAAGGR